MDDGATELVDESEVLRRQVHPNQHPAGSPSSEAFMPSENDKMRLSTHRGRVDPAECYRRWTQLLRHRSVGTYGVSVGECIEHGLAAIDDETPAVPDHASVDFSACKSKGKRKQRARKLRDAAVGRGILFEAP